MATHALRTVFISDIHLGSPHCHAAELALSSRACAANACISSATLLIFGGLHRTVHTGAPRTTWCWSNCSGCGHDRPVRRLCGLALPAMEIRRRAIHVTADGRRLLFVYGDEYDAQTQFGGVHERFGYRYWSRAGFIKRRSTAAETFVARYMDARLSDARRRQLHGIVCGYVHRATLQLREGLVYASDGDWVESLTALVEDADGGLRLLSHTHDTLARLPPRCAAAMSVPSIGRAA